MCNTDPLAQICVLIGYISIPNQMTVLILKEEALFKYTPYFEDISIKMFLQFQF